MLLWQLHQEVEADKGGQKRQQNGPNGDDQHKGTEQSRAQPGFILEDDVESDKSSSDFSEDAIRDLLAAPTPPRPPRTFKGIAKGCASVQRKRSSAVPFLLY